MALELYWGSGSPFAWRVLLTLEIKGLPYDSKLLEFSKGEHKAPEFLAINPRGKVPALKDGGFMIYESLAIMVYLDRKYPEPALFGKTAEESGLIWQAISESEYLKAAGDKVVRPIFFGKGLEQTDAIQDGAQSMRGELTLLNQRLEHSPWLAGGAISAADIAIFPLVQLCLRAAAKEAARPFDLRLLPLDQTYPAVARWVRGIEALPFYERTYPPHWRTQS